jgi:peptidyl-prolyl cis-trans isomerase B (cyclophilin B)
MCNTLFGMRSKYAVILALCMVPAVARSLAAQGSASAPQRRPLAAADIDNIATLLKLEDTRQFDEPALSRVLASTHPEVRRRAAIAIGRIADAKGDALLQKMRADSNAVTRGAVVFATGQLKIPANTPWLAGLLQGPTTSPAIAREAAQALGKISILRPDDAQAARADARAALAAYLSKAAVTTASAPVVGEALLSIGRFGNSGDIAPVARFTTSPNLEVRWRAAWALVRAGNPAAMPSLVKLAADPSAEVRYWVVRAFTPTMADNAQMNRRDISNTLRSLVIRDPDRRVRLEAFKVLMQYEDENAFAAFANALDSSDTWMSVSAAEAAGRFVSRAPTASIVNEAASESKPLALRMTALAPLVTLSPGSAAKLAVSLAHSDTNAARALAFQTLSGMGELGIEALDYLARDASMSAYSAQIGSARSTAAARAAGPGAAGGNRGAGAGGNRGAAGAPPNRGGAPRPDAEYRALVEKWIVPAYNGRPGPRAIWETPRGEIELELYPGDSPLGTEYFLKAVESGDIVGTEFTRLVPDFVAQQAAIRNAVTLRDEVNQRGLTRGNLSWASAGLDTGRPGYTLGNTPQPHNEGNFTSLGRVVRGMDVVDKLERGDKVTAARMVK